MKLEDLKRLAAARTKGEWKVSGQCFITKKPAPHLYDSINGGTMEDAEFIAACANNIDALIAVVEAAEAERKAGNFISHELWDALKALDEEGK